MNLSRDPDGVARCCQKEYSLTRDPGSSSTPARPAVANVVKNSHTDGLGQKIKKRKKLQAASFKQQAA